MYSKNTETNTVIITLKHTQKQILKITVKNKVIKNIIVKMN